jgi:hypothetical protein
LDKYHGNDKPADETGANAETTPKAVASPDADEPSGAHSNGSSRPARKNSPQAVKAGNADAPMQRIGKK